MAGLSIQFKKLANHPEMIWQLARFLKSDIYPHEDISIHGALFVSLNGRKPMNIIDGYVDLLSTPYHVFSHDKYLISYSFDDEQLP